MSLTYSSYLTTLATLTAIPATDLIGCIIKQSNANMRANELNDKRVSGKTLTAGEEAEASALRNLAIAIKAIRAKSDAIEAMAQQPSASADSLWS